MTRLAPYVHLEADAGGTTLVQKSCQELDQNPPRVVAYGVATEKACGHLIPQQ